MTVELMLVRHGNTFGPGDRVVWVGAGEDLPLVERGREQAAELGAALARIGWRPTAAVSSGLLRQREHLDIAVPPDTPRAVDAALSEIDYGRWGGLTTEEITERFGADEVTAWGERSEWPTEAGWGETEDEVRARVRGFAAKVAEGVYGERVLACSSNGVLRWFLDLAEGALGRAVADGTFKVGTGRVGRLAHPGGSGVDWEVRAWNLKPEELTASA